MPRKKAKSHPLTPEKWLELVEIKSDDKLSVVLSRQHTADIASLIEHLAFDLRLHIINLLEPSMIAEVLAEVSDDISKVLLNMLPVEKVVAIVDILDSDDAVDLLRQLKPKRLEEVIQSLPDELRPSMVKLLSYDEETAGGIMTMEAAIAPANAGVGEVIEHIRQFADTIKEIYYVYLVDDFGKLVGAVPLKNLILSSDDEPVIKLIDTDIVSIPEGMDQEEVASIFQKYNLVSAPVIDSEGHLIGRITHDDIMDVIREEVDEDFAHFTGQSDIAPAERSLYRNLKKRLPWLLLAMIGSVGAAHILSHFEGNLAMITALVFFLPLIPAMGGNAGIQTSAVMVRGLATGEIASFGIYARIMRELSIAFFNGLACGMAVFAFAYIWQNDFMLALVVGSALMAVIVLAAMIGVVVPLLLKFVGIDPAVATGPFITTTNDILGVAIYMVIASWMLFKI